eukprot:5466906-Pleurochrysis_carterae.AAC.1
MTLGEAVSSGLVANETLGFFIGRTCARACTARTRSHMLAHARTCSDRPARARARTGAPGL